MIWVDTLTGNGVFVMVSGDEYAKQIDAELDSLRATARAVWCSVNCRSPARPSRRP